MERYLVFIATRTNGVTTDDLDKARALAKALREKGIPVGIVDTKTGRTIEDEAGESRNEGRTRSAGAGSS
jgi:hypothetical protein